MGWMRSALATVLRAVADRLDPQWLQAAKEEAWPVPPQAPLTEDSWGMMAWSGPQRKEPVHALDCDMGEDCTCGAQGKQPLAGSARARYADAKRR